MYEDETESTALKRIVSNRLRDARSRLPNVIEKQVWKPDATRLNKGKYLKELADSLKYQL